MSSVLRGKLSAIGFALALGATDPSGAQIITGSASTQYGSGNTVLAGTAISSYPLAVNGATPSVALTANGGRISADAVSAAKTASSGLGVSGWSKGRFVSPSDSGLVQVVGDARIHYTDTIQVTSATLPAGAPVSVHFALQIAYLGSAVHAVGTSLGPDQQENNAFYLMQVSAGAADVIGGSSFQIEGSANRAFFDTAPGTGVNLGLFDGPSHLDFTLASAVGRTLSFDLELQATATVDLGPRFPEAVFASHGGSASAGLGAAFGATADLPGVELQSAVLNGAFPEALAATPQNALAAIPEAPAGAVATVLSLAVIGVARTVRRRRGELGGDCGPYPRERLARWGGTAIPSALAPRSPGAWVR